MSKDIGHKTKDILNKNKLPFLQLKVESFE